MMDGKETWSCYLIDLLEIIIIMKIDKERPSEEPQEIL